MNHNIIYSKSRLNGWHGNECVYKKEYDTAIKYYSNAIELYPMEYRYFVNRSYCFDHLKKYDLALEDSNMAIILNESWGKCHFRKGRALKGLKRLEEAEICFIKVIELEGNDCREANNELLSIRKLAVLNLGADQRTAFDVANKCIDIKEAINTMKQMEHLKSDDKSIKSKSKRSNKNHNSMRNNSYGRQQNYTRSQPNANARPDKSNSETNKSKSNIDSDSKSKTLIHSSNDCRNILKKLSDILLNTNVNTNITQINVSNDVNEKVESLVKKSPIKIEEKSDRKCPTDDNKSIKSYKSDSNQSNYSNESKSRYNGNKNRNLIKNKNNLDQIIEIREQMTECSITIRTDNSSHSNSSRNSEPTNPWRLKGLWISNVISDDYCKDKLKEILSKFGKISFFGIIPDSQTAIVDYDNCESPRVAMSKLQGAHIPNVSAYNARLNIKFRPLYGDKNYPSISYANDRKLNNECYFWRTTGCNPHKFCKLKHIPINKGVDLQPWMQNVKNPYKRPNRQRYGTL